MKYFQLLNRSFRPVYHRRRYLRLALLSGLCMLFACMPSKPLGAQPKNKLTEVVRIQPFRLEKSFRFDWRKERPEVRSGLLVVIKVDTSLVRPTNDLEPVLYAGTQTVQRLNLGYESGFLIGIIPMDMDLSKEPVWFGSPALPERVDEKIIRAERARAIRSGIAPLKPAELQERTRQTVAVADLSALLREFAAALVLEFAPQEKRLAESWRLPETGK